MSYAARGATVATDLIVLILTWTKTWRLRKQAKEVKMASPIATLLLRDGLWLLSCSVLGIMLKSLLRRHNLLCVSVSSDDEAYESAD